MHRGVTCRSGRGTQHHATPLSAHVLQQACAWAGVQHQAPNPRHTRTHHTHTHTHQCPRPAPVPNTCTQHPRSIHLPITYSWLQSADPDQPVMIYCTGGIRCDVYGTYLRKKG